MGITAAELAGQSTLPQGQGGRLTTEPDLSVAGQPNVFAIGDIAANVDPDGHAFPQLGSVALQAGRWAAANILADIDGKARKPFHYKDKGIMAMIGDNAAIAEVGAHHHELHGTIAFAAWLGVHAWLLSGTRRRVDAFVSWAWDFFGSARASSAVVDADAARIDWGDDDDGPCQCGWDAGTRHQGPARDRSHLMSDHFDVIIIGTGAGGGTLLHTLAPSGRRILVLERGDFLPREMENWDPGEVFVKGRYISPDTWYDSDGKELKPQVHYYVGGMTKLYGAALYRLRPQDFGELRHVDGISPAWPLGYDDFEPWYTKAEWLYQVHGNVGEDPTEGHHSRPYPWPGLSHEPRIQQIADSLAGAGYQPFHAPCGILSTRPTGRAAPASAAPGATATPASCTPRRTPRRSPCARCWTCPTSRLLVGAEVTKLLTDSGGTHG